MMSFELTLAMRRKYISSSTTSSALWRSSTVSGKIRRVELRGWLQDAPAPKGEGPLSLKLEHVEAWAIRQVMEKTKGNVSRAAKILDIARETLATKLKKYGIAREEWVNGNGAANGTHAEAAAE